jgi:hypothetical protein
MWGRNGENRNGLDGGLREISGIRNVTFLNYEYYNREIMCKFATEKRK